MEEKTNAIELAVALTTAWLGNPNTRCAPEDVHAFLQNSHATLVCLAQPKSEPEQERTEPSSEFTPAVGVRKSLADPDYIVSMIDGKPYRSLRRHLTARGLTPEAYRERYGLKPDYPMVAPSYAAQRSRLAKDLGLGRKGAGARASASTSPAVAAADAPAAPAVKDAAPKKPRTKRSGTPAATNPEATQAGVST